MTITPVPVRPATATQGARDDRPAGDPEGFAALVSRETDRLAGSSGRGRSGAAGDASEPDGGTADAAAVEVPADAVPGVLAVQGTGPVGSFATAPGGVALGAQAGRGEGEATGGPSAQAEGPEVGSAGALPTEAGVPGPPQAAATTSTGTSTAGGEVAAGDLASTGASGPEVATTGGPGSGGAVEGGSATGSEGDGTGGPRTVDATALLTGSSADLDRTDQGVTSAGASPTADAGTDPVTAPGTVTPTTSGTEAAGEPAPSAPAARSTAALLDQVSPTLTRLVSRGDGEHRMTLKIHPADLGEVHLTVTVRGERVDVDIAASAEARELLRDGLTQLRGLLDPTGRGGGQLVFRDLPQAPAGQPVATETGTGDLGGRSGSADGSAEGHDRRGQPSGSAARTPGAADPAPAPTTAPTRSAGTRTVDLTI